MSRRSCLNRLLSFFKILFVIEDYVMNTTEYFCQTHIHMYRAFSAISLQMSTAEIEELYYFVSYSFEKTM